MGEGARAMRGLLRGCVSEFDVRHSTFDILMKLLFLTRGDDHPGTRYRVTPFLPPLRAAGFEAVTLRYPHGPLGWYRILAAARGHQAVFVQKKRLAGPVLGVLRRRGTRVLYDVDDAVMFASSRHADPESPARRRQFERMVRGSDGVIAGNAYLRDLAARHNPRVWLIPTCVDARKYAVRGPAADGAPPILGWIGGRKSLVFLKALAPALNRVAREFPRAALAIVCNEFFEPGAMPVVRKEWSEATEAADVASFDVGLSPLPDDPWSRGKCATKLLQCMAAGVPVVASAVGAHLEIVTDGRDGFLARTEDEWVERIGRLLQDAERRRAMGLAGRRRVEEAYSVEANAPRFVAAVRAVVAGCPTP